MFSSGSVDKILSVFTLILLRRVPLTVPRIPFYPARLVDVQDLPFLETAHKKTKENSSQTYLDFATF